MSGNMDNGNQQGQQQVSASQITTTSTGSTQMAVSSQVQVQQQPTTMQQQVTQQQLQQLQQSANSAGMHGGQHQQNQGQNQMQQLQVVQQQLQNQTYLPQLYNTQGQQLLMPGNILHHGLNPQIQVIAAGKTFQPNQLTSPHMLSAGNIGYTAIPTSGSPNNQTYILGQFINSPQSQLQHTGKHGDLSKQVISPQLGTQLPQGLTWATSPHTFLTTAPNPIFIRGTQPDQMFIQQQQPIQTNAAGQQHFSMPLNAGTTQIPTSIGSVSSTNLQQGQQQNMQGNQQQQNNTQSHVSIKPPATLQPKPPLQIQPQPQQQHQLQQQQQIQQLQQVTMTHAGGTHQIQVIPQQPVTSQTQTTVIPQSISITQQPQIIHQSQQQPPRHLTILPQQNQSHSIQSQQMQFIQQPATAPQPIRPNYTSSSVSIVTTQAPQVQQLSTPVTTLATPQQRPKIRKPGVGRGANANGPQQAKAFPRATAAQAMTPQQRQIQPQGMSQQQLAQTMGRVPVGTTITQHQPNAPPLKTINLSALQQSHLGDGTITTTLIPQNNINLQQVHLAQPGQIQLFPSTSTQLPSPNLTMIQTSALQSSKTDTTPEPNIQLKGDSEKENSKHEEHEEVQGKQKLPKAMVKPQVLTHVIEGFVIQEAAEPFPMPKSIEMDEPPKKKAAMTAEIAKCEMCGKVELKAKLKRKRFCSSICAKNMKTVQQQKVQQHLQMPVPQFTATGTPLDKNQKGVKGRKWGESFEGDTDETSSSVGEHSPNEEGDELPKVNPVKWDVKEVVEFVQGLPGCSEYANDFAEHEIDGQALLLLKADHLMSAMNMKLGPALKLCAKIEAVRAGFGNSTGDTPK